MEMIEANVAQARLTELLDRAAAGEEIVIVRDGEPVARLIACGDKGPQGPRVGGQWKGQVRIGDDFDDPIPGWPSD